MKDVVLSIPDKDYSFFMKLVKSLGFVQVKDTKTKAEVKKKEFLDGLKEAVDEVSRAKRSKTKLKSADQLLDEL